MKTSQKILLGALVATFTTTVQAKGALVYCSEGSPAGFDPA